MENLKENTHKAEIYYYDIGDYLSREDKFKIIEEFGSMEKLPFTRLNPNEHGDWISLRNDRFGTWIALGDKENKDNKNTFFVPYYSNGVKTQRDAWCYNSSLDGLKRNMKFSTDFYNQQRKAFADGTIKELDMNPSKISWTENVMKSALKNQPIKEQGNFTEFLYRPFFKQQGLFSRFWNERTYSMFKIFPTTAHNNLVICVCGVGVTKDFTCIISDTIPDLELIGKSQCFPLYWYETIEPDQNSLFGDDDAQILKHEAISDFILERAQSKYGNKVQREDIFYYVYGILHSKSYRETFEADLKKMLPRIPLVSDYEKFWAFSKAGRELANLHLNYETVAPCPDVTVESLEQGLYSIQTPKSVRGDSGELMVAEGSPAKAQKDEYAYYAVEQMKFPKKGEKGTIIYNHYHTIKNIPEKAYEYVVNGKSATEWIMKRYAVTTDKKSGITNNPNDWSFEHKKPRYILDLLLSVINVSVQTVDIVNSLPEVDWEKE